MAEKIKIVICSGTACFVMGASDILLLEEHLEEALRPLVEIEGTNCLGFCKDSKNGKAPFVTINGVLMSSATLPLVMQKIQEIHDAEY